MHYGSISLYVNNSGSMRDLSPLRFNEGHAVSVYRGSMGRKDGDRADNHRWNIHIERQVLCNNMWQCSLGWMAVMQAAAGMTCSEGQRLRQTVKWRVSVYTKCVLQTGCKTRVSSEQHRENYSETDFIINYSYFKAERRIKEFIFHSFLSVLRQKTDRPLGESCQYVG